MFFRKFKGGVHPHDHKEKTKNIPIENLQEPQMLCFLVSMAGRDAVPTVAKGDRVLKGQVIANGEGFLSLPLHSSVSGIVEKIDRAVDARGNYTEAIYIKNDFADEEAPKKPYAISGNVDKDTLIKATKEAGIVGMGGAGFPSHVKLSTNEVIDTVIINASECEPYLTSDYRLLIEKSEDMVDGLSLIVSAMGAKCGIIALEDNKKDVVKALKTRLLPNMKVAVLRTRYPQGSEKQLIYAVTGRVVKEGKLPASCGCLVFNVDTASAISRAVRKGESVIERIVTVSGGAVKDGANFRAKIGTPYSYLIEAVGGFIKEPKKIISGGPMMGAAICSLDTPVTKTTSGIISLTEEEIGAKVEEPCIRCGACVDNCPMRLSPLTLSKLINNKEWKEAEKEGIMSCIECGCCAYTCPSDRNPVAVIRKGKAALRGAIKK